MKRFLFFLFLPFACAAQGVKLAQYDVFLKKQRIEMEPLTLLSSPSKLTLTFSSLAPDLFVELKGAGWGATTVDEGNELLFLFANDSSVTVTSTGLQTFEPGVPQSTYKHRYRITEAALQALARNELVGLRKFSFKESSEVRIPKEYASKLQKASALFLKELKNETKVKFLQQINAKDVAGHIGDSVQFCSKTYNYRYNAASNNGVAVLELQADFSEPIVNVIIGPEDRLKFGDAPEKNFLNQDVCVTGVLELRDDTPSVVVRNKEQLKLKSSTSETTTR